MVSNKLNAKFKNEISSWENKLNKIVLTKYSSSLTNSNLTFTYKEYDRFFIKLKKDYERKKPSKI
jgi:hypothetical protein